MFFIVQKLCTIYIYTFKFQVTLFKLLDFLPSAVVGELDEELDASLDFDQVRAHPLKSLQH